MIPVLFVVFVFVLFKVLRTPSVSSTKIGNNSAASASTAFNGKIDWELPPPYPENLRDAMVFGPVTQTQEGNRDRPVVKGIVYSEDNPCAVVGDRIVSAGEVVQGATVVKINPDSVEFTKGDENWTQKVER
jgi:type II secretory pathway component PulC